MGLLRLYSWRTDQGNAAERLAVSTRSGQSTSLSRSPRWWEEKFELDLWYVEHRTPLLDLRILAATFVQA